VLGLRGGMRTPGFGSCYWGRQRLCLMTCLTVRTRRRSRSEHRFGDRCRSRSFSAVPP